MEALRRGLRYPLPDDYLSFLAEHNGGEGNVEKLGFVLWPAEEVIALNHVFEIPENYPGFLGFGSTGHAHAFVFDMRAGLEWPVLLIPFVGVREEAREIARDFATFRALLTRRKGGGG